MSSFEINTRTFEKAMTELANESTRTNAEIVTLNSRQILRSIAFNSPRRSGNMNAGWRPAWDALEIPGTPNTRRSKPHKQGSRTYTPAGSFTDGRRQRVPFTEFTNESHFTEKNGKRVNYPHIVAARQNFMGKAESEIAMKMEKMLSTSMVKICIYSERR